MSNWIFTELAFIGKKRDLKEIELNLKNTDLKNHPTLSISKISKLNNTFVLEINTETQGFHLDELQKLTPSSVKILYNIQTEEGDFFSNDMTQKYFKNNFVLYPDEGDPEFTENFNDMLDIIESRFDVKIPNKNQLINLEEYNKNLELEYNHDFKNNWQIIQCARIKDEIKGEKI